MPDPIKSPISCIGCGALSPPGALVCVGCGHRFAGPDPNAVEPTVHDVAPQAPVVSPRLDDAYLTDEPIYIGEPRYIGTSRPVRTFGEQVAITLTWLILTILAGIALVIAFCITCVGTTLATESLPLGMFAGVAAGGLVVFGMVTLSRSLLGDSRRSPRRGKPR